MPTLEEISEAATKASERCIRDSMALDYAYLADTRAMAEGGRVGRLNDFIERQYQELIGNGNG